MTRHWWILLVAAHLAGLAVIVGRDALTMSPGAPRQVASDERPDPFMLARVRTPTPRAVPIVIEFRFAYCTSTCSTVLFTFSDRVKLAHEKV